MKINIECTPSEAADLAVEMHYALLEMSGDDVCNDCEPDDIFNDNEGAEYTSGSEKIPVLGDNSDDDSTPMTDTDEPAPVMGTNLKKHFEEFPSGYKV